MTDRSLVMDGGRIDQHDTLLTVYEPPAMASVAGVVGEPPMSPRPTTYPMDQPVRIAVAAADLHVFGPTGRRIGTAGPGEAVAA